MKKNIYYILLYKEEEMFIDLRNAYLLQEKKVILRKSVFNLYSLLSCNIKVDVASYEQIFWAI